MLIPKTNRIRREFEDLKKRNGPLAALMLDLADFVNGAFQKDVVMTMIYRSQEEQWQLYEKTDGKRTKRTSPHMYWDAVDIRERVFTHQEKQAIKKFLRKHYDATNKLAVMKSAHSRTVLLHAIKGNVMHFHIQYKGPLVYVFSHGATIRSRPHLDSSHRFVNVHAVEV
jgi:hypothetical protein